MTKILNTTTLTFLQETTFIFYTIAFGWIITTRLEKKLDENQAREQAGFRCTLRQITYMP